MSSTLPIVRPEAGRFNGQITDLNRSVHCICARDDEGRIISKATASSIELDGERYLITADHVFKSLVQLSGTLAVTAPTLGTSGSPTMRKAIASGIHELPALPLIWSDSRLDVAVLQPSARHIADPALIWLDAREHAALATNIARQRWKTGREDAVRPVSVMGFPNFGHLTLEAARTEILSCVPIDASIGSWPAPWDGTTMPPQLRFVMDARGQRIEDILPFEEFLARGLEWVPPSDSDAKPFGGISGGLIVMHFADRFIVIGIVSAGDWFLGIEPHGFGAAWDDIISEHERRTRVVRIRTSQSSVGGH